MLTNKEFAQKCKDIAQKYNTLYVYGCFGARLTKANKERYTNNYAYNKQLTRKSKIALAVNKGNVYGFDCVCLIKGVLWGWSGDANATYGGAYYCSNGVQDLSANGLFNTCTNKSKDFTKIEVGEAVWKDGHIGVYIGDGLAVECTPIWKDGVQITAVNKAKKGYNTRVWTTHGKLPYVKYVAEAMPQSAPQTHTKKTNAEIVKEVLAGKWGNGPERKEKLTKAGYNYTEIQKLINASLKTPAKKSVDEIAREVVAGKWGNGKDRKDRLTKAGYDYYAVQKAVVKYLK